MAGQHFPMGLFLVEAGEAASLSASTPLLFLASQSLAPKGQERGR